jgi:hypothetical protein
MREEKDPPSGLLEVLCESGFPPHWRSGQDAGVRQAERPQRRISDLNLNRTESPDRVSTPFALISPGRRLTATRPLTKYILRGAAIATVVPHGFTIAAWKH